MRSAERNCGEGGGSVWSCAAALSGRAWDAGELLHACRAPPSQFVGICAHLFIFQTEESYCLGDAQLVLFFWEGTFCPVLFLEDGGVRCAWICAGERMEI